ncbi:hypothetical protein COP2_044992 [Malus domestica]
MGFQEIEEAPAFSKVGLAHKPPIPDIEECQLSQPRQHPSHANSALRKSRAICRSADSNHLSLSASSALVTCNLCPQRSSELEA